MTRYDGLVLQTEKFGKRVASKNLSNYKVVKKGEFVVGFPIDEGVIFALKHLPCGVVSPVYTIWKKINDSVDSDFLDYYLKTPEMILKYKQVMVHAVERRRYIKKEDFLTLTIPLPPLHEQRAIAKALKTVKEAKGKTDAVIAVTTALKTAMIMHLFTFGLASPDETCNVVLKKTEFEPVPETWEIKKMKDIGTFQYGFTASAIRDKKFVKFLRITDIQENGYIDWNSVPNCNIPQEDLKKYQLKENDILIARIGATTGKTCIINKLCPDSVFASYLIKFSIDPMYVPEYIFYFTQTKRYWGCVNSGKEGKLKKGLSASELKDFKVLLPPKNIQEKIVGILNSVDQKLASELSYREALDTLFTSLLHGLMTAKIRVNPAEAA